MRYRLAIFDFDGTLADSFPFFISTFNRLAEQHAFKRIHPEEVEVLRRYSPREMMAYLGMPAWKLPIVARSFTALMRQNRAAISLFDGVATTLAYLAERQVIVALVSSNAQDNVTQILGPSCRHIRHFECGASIFGKASRLRRVLQRAGVPPREAIYIGDQPTDYEAATAAGICFGAVSWGYGTMDIFRDLRCDEEFRAVADMRRIAGEAD